MKEKFHWSKVGHNEEVVREYRYPNYLEMQEFSKLFGYKTSGKRRSEN